MNLGTNMAYLTLEQVNEMGLKRIELCQNKRRTFMENTLFFDETLIAAQKLALPVSIHLPYVVPEDLPWGFLDAYFLDEDPMKSDAAFDFLELNLNRLADFEIAYCVLHFVGIYESLEAPDVFMTRLKRALDRLDRLAEKYKRRILVEYFGSNVNFYNVKVWIDTFKAYKHLGLLLDVCHFYFSAKWRGFDFEANLNLLVNAAEAFHLWTTFGDGVYQEAEGYLKYHHIVPNINQTVAEGWAFDTQKILAKLAVTQRPIIVEASPNYGHFAYYIESLEGLVAFIEGN